MIVSKLKWIAVLLFILSININAITVEDFKDTNVLIEKDKGEEFYLVIAKKSFHFDENKFEKERVLSLKAKANLANYLNKVNNSNFTYRLNNFLLIDFFEKENEAEVIGKILKENVEIVGNKSDEISFEDYIKKNVKDYDGVEIVEFENDYYIISVQRKKIKGLSLKERTTSIKDTNTKAEREFYSFLEENNTKLQKKLPVTKVIRNGKIEEKEEYLENTDFNSNEIIENYKIIYLKDSEMHTCIVYSKFDIDTNEIEE